VQNTGTAPAAPVLAALVLPSRLRLVTAPGSFRWFANGGAWSVASLAPGASVAFTVTFRAGAAGPATVVAAACAPGSGASATRGRTTATVLVTAAPTSLGAATPHGAVGTRRVGARG
jgi:hypothetical protein